MKMQILETKYEKKYYYQILAYPDDIEDIRKNMECNIDEFAKVISEYWQNVYKYLNKDK